MNASGDRASMARSRMQKTMQKTAESLYYETLDDLDNVSRDLDRAIAVKIGLDVFHQKLEQWMICLADVKYAEVEWAKYLNGQELQEMLSTCKQTMLGYTRLRTDAVEYIDSILQATSPAGGDVTPSQNPLEREIERLGYEIQQLSRTMSRTNIGDRSHGDSGSSSRVEPRQAEENNLVTTPTASGGVLRAQAPAFAPSGPITTSSVESVLQRQSEAQLQMFKGLTNTLTDLHHRDRIPRFEPEVYAGDLLKFPMWWTSFNMLINSDVLSEHQKLLYLYRYTAKDVQNCVAPFMHQEQNPHAYEDAKSRVLERYGDKVKIAAEYRAKLNRWTPIREGDAVGLRAFSDFLWQCLSAVSSIGYLSSLEHPDENKKLALKLPAHASRKWNAEVVDALYPPTGQEGQTGEYPSFRRFCEFVSRQAKLADGPCIPKARTSEPEVKNRRTVQNFSVSSGVRKASPEKVYAAKPRATNTADKTPEKSPVKKKCWYCQDPHHISKCEKFLKRPEAERMAFAVDRELCFGCLGRGHVYADCTRRNYSLLHDTPSQPNDVTSCHARLRPASGEHVMSYMVQVDIVNLDIMKSTRVYAAIDTQSEACFIAESAARRLQFRGTPTTLPLSTLHGRNVPVPSELIGKIKVQGVSEDRMWSLPPCFTRPEIPAHRELAYKHEDLLRWPHLASLVEATPEFDENLDVELLIGINMFDAFVPENGEVRCAGLGKPFAIKTILGWALLGPRGGSVASLASVPVTPASLEEEAGQQYEATMDEVNHAFNGEFETTGPPEIEFSQQDLRFLELMESSVEQDEDGHVRLPLPVKDREADPPPSRHMALKRLESLRRKLDRDEQFREQYVKFIGDMIRNGHAEKVKGPKGGKIWYLPHQGVKHPRKPGVTRVVFDGSAEVRGVSLNSQLMSGPDLNNKLVGVLCRFRLGFYGFTCDIEKMFLQVRVAEGDQDMLRFFWYEDGDTSREPEEYRVLVHLFGATSSPAVAVFALQFVADQYGDRFDQAVPDFIKNRFYVDDGLGSADSEAELLKLMLDSRALCQLGGFNLTKYACSSPLVMSQIPEDMRAGNLEEYTLGPVDSAKQVTLGMLWSLVEDGWKYTVKSAPVTHTRRGLLSALSSIYDPLGLISPVLLQGRNLLQRICKQGTTWDEPLEEAICVEWDSWYSQLVDLEGLVVRRCYRDQVRSAVQIQYHLFADASTHGYGACGYVLFRDADGHVDVSLVIAKSKVHPTKAMTIPRMELQAAVLAVKLLGTMKTELPYKNYDVFLWTDSLVVLGYLMNDAKRFHVFVTNRVQYIQDHSERQFWRHVSGPSNPADLASRGATAKELMESDIWWRGSEVMLDPHEPLDNVPLDPEDPALKRVVVCNAVMHTTSWFFSDVIEQVQSWQKIISFTAIWRRYMYCLLRRVRKEPAQQLQPFPSVRERREAEQLIVMTTQQDYMPQIYAALVNGTYPVTRAEAKARKKELGSVTNLFRLDPYIDQEGIIRVGGRIRRGEFTNEEKHPRVLPFDSPIVVKLVRFHHCKVGHAGVNHTLGALRCAGWWILRARRVINKVVSTCVVCSYLRGPMLMQKMADLPRDRLMEAPAFTYCGVDMIGPITVAQNRSQRKRWIALYMCLVTRGVHLEVCQDLSTDSFLSAYRNFVCRRGPVRLLRSDQGTNIMGARSEMRRLWQDVDMNTLGKKLAEQGCDLVNFKPNVPRAPHMGGAWERLVQSVKRTLTALLHMQPARLDDWNLKTFVTEAECIVNSRPLTYIESGDADQPTPLSPARLLTLKDNPTPPPPGKFTREDLYGVRRWRRSQYLADQFWHRWRTEYLPTIQQRKKWLQKQDCVRTGDVVLVQEDNLERSAWPMGRVLDVRKSEDGLVRSVHVKTRAGTYERPVTRLVLLMRPDSDEEENGVEAPEVA